MPPARSSIAASSFLTGDVRVRGQDDDVAAVLSVPVLTDSDGEDPHVVPHEPGRAIHAAEELAPVSFDRGDDVVGDHAPGCEAGIDLAEELLGREVVWQRIGVVRVDDDEVVGLVRALHVAPRVLGVDAGALVLRKVEVGPRDIDDRRVDLDGVDDDLG